jgi:hypothetical protein
MFVKVRSWTRAVCAGPALLAGAWPICAGDARTTRPVDGIRDNSFLVEEAYNQETGVVQHIGAAFYQQQRGAGVHEERLELSFTQEWPLYGQTHQFSYTVPTSFVWHRAGNESGLGDVMLHYRWQVWFQERSLSALAPRVSLILPTGDTARGLSEDTLGAQFNLPLSTTFAGRWFVHANAGTTILPDAASVRGRTLQHWNLGGSLIYAAASNLHLMLEWIGTWNETTRANGGKRHEFVSLLAPGIRKAFDCRQDAQLVLGLAAPVGLTSASADIGVFLYVSLEHSFRSKRQTLEPGKHDGARTDVPGWKPRPAETSAMKQAAR